MAMLLDTPLPALDDPDGARVPDGLPPVIDAHVHLFPDRLFDAIWAWFDRHGWPIRHRLYTPQVIEFLLSRGVHHMVALHYAHKPGIARGMNAYMAGVCRAHPQVTGLATVLPGEPDARAILAEAAALGLSGVKLHCHVQCFAPDAPELTPLYEFCAERGWPMVMHAGREPASPALKCDPRQLCSAARIEAVLQNHPRLKLCIPHLGSDEMVDYARLLERFDNLWLDTTMVLADYFPAPIPVAGSPLRFMEIRPDRILYGTDFPNLPYAWDRELTRLARYPLPPETLARVLGGNARDLFGITR